MKKVVTLLSACAAFCLCFALIGCGGPSSYSQTVLEEAPGIKVEATNGTADQETTTEGGLVVEKDSVVVISPDTEKGSFHLTITPSGSATPVYDDNVEGRVLFTIALEPGTYDVTTYGNKVTGTLVVSVWGSELYDSMNESLEDALAEAGIDPESLPSLDEN